VAVGANPERTGCARQSPPETGQHERAAQKALGDMGHRYRGRRARLDTEEAALAGQAGRWPGECDGASKVAVSRVPAHPVDLPKGELSARSGAARHDSDESEAE
jgi:hypothetical protein